MASRKRLVPHSPKDMLPHAAFRQVQGLGYKNITEDPIQLGGVWGGVLWGVIMVALRTQDRLEVQPAGSSPRLRASR